MYLEETFCIILRCVKKDFSIVLRREVGIPSRVHEQYSELSKSSFPPDGTIQVFDQSWTTTFNHARFARMDLSGLILTALRRRRFPRMMLQLSINNGQQLQIGTPAVLASEFSVRSVSCAVCLLASDKDTLT